VLQGASPAVGSTPFLRRTKMAFGPGLGSVSVLRRASGDEVVGQERPASHRHVLVAERAEGGHGGGSDDPQSCRRVGPVADVDAVADVLVELARVAAPSTIWSGAARLCPESIGGETGGAGCRAEDRHGAAVDLE